MNKKLLILIAIFPLIIAGSFISKAQTTELYDYSLNLSNGNQWLFSIVTVGALIDSLNPCAISVLLLTIGFFLTVGAFRSNILKFGLVYIIGLFVSYFLIGLGIFSAFNFFGAPKFMAKIGAVLLIVLGIINLLKNLFPQLSFGWLMQLPKSGSRLIGKLINKSSLPAVFLIGIVVGLFEFPCTGGPYLMVLGLLHDCSTCLRGLFYLLYYNFIFVLPLLIILLLAGNKLFIEKIRQWQQEDRKIIKLGMPIIMIGLGVLIFFL